MTQAPAAPPTAALQRFQELLRELLQLDLADLDFGIYKLLNERRAEVDAFLSEELPRRVDEAFSGMADAEREAADRDVERLAERVRETLGAGAFGPDGRPNPEDVDRPAMQEYLQARARLDNIVATDEQKAEVFNHLHAFLSRYYDAGDFIPHRRYGRHEAYAVPYNGEETLFHWVNRDQHYVKTGEQFRDYAFRVAGGDVQVRFSLASATTARDNTKGDTRYFFPLAGGASWDADASRLSVSFEYRLPTEAEVAGHTGAKLQEALLADAVHAIAEHAADAPTRGALLGPDPNRPGDETALLLRHLRHFAKRNTTDYFIHRDLGGFLRGELEFYLKDQIVHLADLDGDLGPRQRMLRVVRELAGVIIGFLAEIEDAQRRLFEKRKFVLRTDYLVTMRCIGRELWPRIAANEDQRSAWRELFAIEPDEIGADEAAFSAFFESHPTLVVDTRHFDEAFRDDLLATFDDLDGMTAGLLVHGENYQALRLLGPTLAGKVKCIYIDPPYNKGGDDDFIYKDRYQHSSWLSMITERLALAVGTLTDDGVIFVSIDDHEVINLIHALDRTAGLSATRLLPAITNLKGNYDTEGFVSTHEYVVAATAGALGTVGELAVDEDVLASDWEEDDYGYWKLGDGLRRTGADAGRDRRPHGWFPIFIHGRPAALYVTDDDQPLSLDDEVLWPVNGGGAELSWTWSKAKIRREPHSLLIKGEAGSRAIYKKQRASLGDVPTRKPKSFLYAPEYSSTSGGSELKKVMGDRLRAFTPKSVRLLEDLTALGSMPGDTVLDFFAGSGTLGHAAINLLRRGQGRRFVLAEVATYFDSVLLPRLMKVAFTPYWNDGVPTRLPDAEVVERSPRVMKVVRLEGYDDTLHNVEEIEAVQQIDGLFDWAVEHGSALLKAEALSQPFDYEIEVLTDDGPRKQNVDLVETFNLAYGVHVERIQVWTNEADRRRYRAVIGHKDGHRLLILWRDMVEPPLDPRVERTFLEGRIEPGAYDEVLINGDSAVPGIASLDPIFKRLIEEEDR